MASSSLIVKEDKNNNRSDPSRMFNSGQTTLAQLRPEKLDDVAIKRQISIIQQTCGEIDPDIIALVFHECDYNLQHTISRIQAGDFEDGGWQTAKSNNKKKNNNNNNNLSDQILNGNTQSDSERSLSQHTSPTPSLRGGAGGHRRQDHYQYPSSRTNPGGRRGNDSNRNHFIPRYPSRNYPTNNPKSINTPNQQNPSETILSSKQQAEQSNEEITPTTSSSTDEYEFLAGTTQSLTFDNSLKKTSVPQSLKRPIPSSIPQQPVSMHPTVQYPTEPIDIQFGDVQWNDSMPITVSPSNNPNVVKSSNDQEILPFTVIHDHEQHSDLQDNLSSKYVNHQTTNETDIQLLRITNRLSPSLSIPNNPLANNLAVVPLESTSHLSDHLTNSLQQQQQAPLHMTSSSSSLTDTIHVPPTSTPRVSEYTPSISQINNPFLSNTLQPTLSNTSNGISGNLSAFTPYNTPITYQSLPREYTQTASSWNQQTPNYKSTLRPTMIQAGNYPQQQSYQLPPQQQFFVGPYPYHNPTLYQVITPVDSWSTAGYPSSLEPYSTYPTTNYLPTYPSQQQYHPATVPSIRYDQYAYDKDVFAHYGQTRSSNNDLSISSQQTKDAPSTSKLSATAAAFSQGAPLTATSPATAVYFNTVPYAVPTYFTSSQDRTISYPSNDSRDNRNGASYGGNYNQNQYHQQQRTHNNSTWHSQQ